LIDLIYRGVCPGCGGDICSRRLGAGLLCRRCQPEEGDPCERESRFSAVCSLWSEVEAFQNFFEKRLGFPPRRLQMMWGRRVLQGLSFTLLAPTGIGKTTFGLALAAFLSPRKSYLLFPTQLLVHQATEKLQLLGVSPLSYHSALSRKRREEVKEKIASGEFQILVTTTNFLYRNFSLIPPTFHFIFVDDVDSVVKRGRNVERLLGVAGFGEEEIRMALEVIDLKRAMVKGRGDPERLRELQERLEAVRKREHATLVVSSATATPRSKRVRLFRELLGFEAGRPTMTLRNVVDLYQLSDNVWERSRELVGQLGGGGLIFLSPHEGKERLEEYLRFLADTGMEIQSYEELDLQRFRRGEVDLVVGFASSRNPLARGIDLPERVRYALFVGVPRMEFWLEREHPSSLYSFLRAFLVAGIEERGEVRRSLEELYPLLSLPVERLDREKRERVESAALLLSLLLQKYGDLIENDPRIPIEIEEGRYKLLVPDLIGYIQASGRTSRLWVGGLTKGLSYLLVDSPKGFEGLKRRARWFGEIEFREAQSVDLDSLLREIDREREEIKRAIGEGGEGFQRDPFSTALVVVESPNKARTLASLFGKPLVREREGVKVYEILKEGKSLSIAASKGHLFDLDREEGFHGVLREEGEFVELFEPIDRDRKERVEGLRRLALEVDEVYIATDPDREGEKIAYDLILNIRPFNRHLLRSEFHEVTRRAFEEAVERPREEDEGLVKAQLVRRVADRWIGFEVSRYLQRKFQRKNLSAGRVQTAVLEWIVLREYEAREQIFVVEVQIGGMEIPFPFEKREEALSFAEGLRQVEVRVVEKGRREISSTPLSTDKLLSLAWKELRISPQEAMKLAQELFEWGIITYHRTDSIRVSDVGIALARAYITEHFGRDYFRPRPFAESGGAHEAIRPTREMDREGLEEFMVLKGLPLEREHVELYDLIFRTFIASQMRPAVVEEVRAEITARGERKEVEFYSRIVEHGTDLIRPIPLHSLEEGSLRVEGTRVVERPRVPRYSYAQIIGMMKERGIGRPSTYAITLEKLVERHYIFQRGGVLFATRLGIAVYEEIRAHPPLYHFVNEDFTRELEEIIDRVALGELDFQEELERLYRELRKELDEDTL